MDQDSDSSSQEPDAAVIPHTKIKEEGDDQEIAEADLSTGYEGQGEPVSEESDYVEEYEDEDDDNASSAAESQDLRSPLKRPLSDAIAVYRPFKRQRSELNFGYLELLNEEIQNAAQRISFGDQEPPPASQIGLTTWSPAEKQSFFEAVARLGKHNLPGIAAKVGSKSVAEISQYLMHLQDACESRRQQVSRSILELAEYPAAVEISQQCCHAQEEAADEISVKQEVREEMREQSRWGDIWDVTPNVAKKLSRDVHLHNQDATTPSDVPQFAQLLHLSKWLELSARMFMNSSVPANNWNSIDENPPSMWATTFDDFHSLAVSVTRRLVQTTLFMAMSRIRSKTAIGWKIRDMVLPQDVEAAISSLNMASKSNEAWIGSARRLRLDVYEEPPEEDEDPEEDRMTYEEVERALSDGGTTGPQQQSQPVPPSLPQLSHSEDEDGMFSDASADSSRSVSPIDEEEQQVDMETREVLEYTIGDIRPDKATRKALRACIATDRLKERQAEEADQHASYKAEVDMWNVLQKEPPMDLPKRQDPGPPRRSAQSMDNFFPSGRDWARKLLYYSEWETLPLPEPEPELGLKEEDVVMKQEEEAGDEGGDEAEEEAEQETEGAPQEDDDDDEGQDVEWDEEQ
ncbi:myb transcriptional regulator [Trichoderma parareesei]|uniref:Myb transcriptional regulator n=1 Tax=Trichoderma parareesei TaxID=858221 RepID=A0A2H2ZM78_TRIPA|nr:myb transcriptional regulator [Trichoderma parareesei]